MNRQRQGIELQTSHKRRELEEVARKLDGLIEAIADGLRTPGLKGKLDELERRKADLEAGLAAAPAPQPRLHSNLAEVYRQKVARLQAALAEPQTRTEALEILRGLIERVVLRPVSGGFEVELIGEIARMVALGQDAGSRKATSAGDVACSVKVVAGARNQRESFRLRTAV